MPRTTKNPKVDKYIARNEAWQKELAKLRSILLTTGLTEDLKWGVPCYTDDEDRNVVLMHAFKEYCAVLFPKGALLKDPDGILIQQTKHVQAARQIRFTNVREVTGVADILKEYVAEAAELERAGAKVPKKKTEEYEVPEELTYKLESDDTFRAAFNALTPGRQRGYLLYFSSAKQSATRTSRIEKCTKRIMEGKGWNE